MPSWPGKAKKAKSGRVETVAISLKLSCYKHQHVECKGKTWSFTSKVMYGCKRLQNVKKLCNTWIQNIQIEQRKEQAKLKVNSPGNSWNAYRTNNLLHLPCCAELANHFYTDWNPPHQSKIYKATLHDLLCNIATELLGQRLIRTALGNGLRCRRKWPKTAMASTQVMTNDVGYKFPLYCMQVKITRRARGTKWLEGLEVQNE